MSISLRVSDCTDLFVKFFFARYEQTVEEDADGAKQKFYKRKQYTKLVSFDLSSPEAFKKKLSLFATDTSPNALQAELLARRTINSDRSVTVFITNRIQLENKSKASYSEMFFQPQVVVKAKNGKIVPIETYNHSSADNETKELALQ